jgi:hypothetical protein
VTVSNSAEARRLAQDQLTAIASSSHMALALLDEHTIEVDFGWIFFWTSTKYRETGEFRYAVAGNGPLIVDRRDGSVHEASTARTIEETIESYRSARPMAG